MLQAPVARDLRTILAAVYCAEKIERMGDLAAHIADTARFTHPEHAVPAEFEGVFTELGEIADNIGLRLPSNAGYTGSRRSRGRMLPAPIAKPSSVHDHGRLHGLLARVRASSGARKYRRAVVLRPN